MKNIQAKDVRAIALFVMGGAGFIHEVIVTKGERPTLLLACLALMGLEVWLRKDEKNGNGDKRERS